jgi:2-phosphosulfolactate phosphatase
MLRVLPREEMIFDQAEFDIRCEWGEDGVASLAAISDAIIIVDVMSFCTAVVIATARGAIVYPYRWRDDSVVEFAKSRNAELAGPRGNARYSLSPVSLMSVPAGTRLVLPGSNGSVPSLSTCGTPTFAGCLRNARAVAEAAAHCGKRVSVIPCGERWKRGGSLRPAFEDWVGAGAIIGRLPGSLSPEARAAVSAYRDLKAGLLTALRQCSSGKELIEMGFEGDIPPIAEVDVDQCVPVLRDGAYVRAEPVA